MTAGTTGVHAVAGRVAAEFDVIFTTVDEWGAVIAHWLQEHQRPTTAELDETVEALVLGALQPRSLVTGAGFVATPGLLAHTHWHLAWWLRGEETLRRLSASDDPTSDDFRDYTALEWWRYPERTGSRHLTGPYVDYLCTDDYTITVTAPVLVGGRMAGVVGADALVDRLESRLLPELREAGGSLTLVAASGRVVMSTDARREPGSMLRIEGLVDALVPLRTGAPGGAMTAMDRVLPAGGRVVSCGDTSLALLVDA